MSKEPSNSSQPEPHGGRWSLSIALPDSFDQVQYGGVSEASNPTGDSAHRNIHHHGGLPNYAILPLSSSSVNKAPSFRRNSVIVDAETSIPTPKASNCSPSNTQIRRSSRLSKTSIPKTSRTIKYKLQDHRKQVQRFCSAQHETKQSGSDSPLCVKKKMGRRGIQISKAIKRKKKSGAQISESVQDMIERNNVNFVFCKGVTGTDNAKADMDVKTLSTKLEKDAPSSLIYLKATQTKQNSIVKNGTSQNNETIQTTKSEIAPKRIETIDCEGEVPSVLFEESEDFWNSYLLDTYQQIASSNPDIQDFEPIPYPYLARGVPVYTENVDEGILTNTATSTLEKKTTNKASVEGTHRDKSRASLKDDISKTNEYNENSESNKAIVGPGSWQMSVINGMLQFLDEVNESPYSKHNIPFQTVTKRCTRRHLEGNTKYSHLPGAIFEEIVPIIGGPAFLEIYKSAKTYSGVRLSHAAVVGYQPSDHKTNEIPSLIQVAVGYGFCMAKSLLVHDQPSTSWDHDNIKLAVDNASQKVTQMTESHRLKFWQEYIVNGNKK